MDPKPTHSETQSKKLQEYLIRFKDKTCMFIKAEKIVHSGNGLTYFRTRGFDNKIDFKEFQTKNILKITRYGEHEL